MSHTFKSGELVAHFNSDLSGRVYLLVTRSEARRDENGEPLINHITIRAEDLIELVAHWVELDRIQALEDMAAREVLGMRPKPGARVVVTTEARRSSGRPDE